MIEGVLPDGVPKRRYGELDESSVEIDAQHIVSDDGVHYPIRNTRIDVQLYVILRQSGVPSHIHHF